MTFRNICEKIIIIINENNVDESHRLLGCWFPVRLSGEVTEFRGVIKDNCTWDFIGKFL